MNMNIGKLQQFIIENWEQEWDDDKRYFIRLKNGDAIGYCFESEAFYLNNYYNEISYDEVMQLLKIFV